MKTKLILSIMSFFVCFMLFSVLSFAWFALGNEVGAGNGDFNVNDGNVKISISLWENDNWVESNQMFLNLGFKKPGDVIYFRFKFHKINNSLTTLNAFSFKNLEAKVSDALFVLDNAIYVKDITNKNVKLYDLMNNQVLDDSGNVWLSYDQTNNKLQLNNHYITDKMNLYVDDSIINPNNINISNLTAYNLTDLVTVNKQFDSEGNVYLYMAVELNLQNIENENQSRFYSYQYFKVLGLDLQVA